MPADTDIAGVFVNIPEGNVIVYEYVVFAAAGVTERISLCVAKG